MNTVIPKEKVNVFRRMTCRPSRLKKVAMFLSSGDADMYDGAIFSLEGDFAGYLGLENMGVFTAHGGENGSPAKLRELREFGASLK